MLKKLLSVTLICIMGLTLPACSSASDESDTVVTLKMNSVKSSADPEYEWWADVLAEIEEKSEGTLKCELYPSEAIGTQANMIEATARGAAILQDCDASWLADYVPDFSIFMAPYVIQEPEEIQQLWESEIGQDMCERLEEQGLKLVTFVYFGTRNLISTTPVESRDDISKLKVRCASTKMWNEVVNVLGGNPTNTAWSETYQAISQGIADGAESPHALLYSSKIYEQAKYITRTEHVVASTAIVMSKELYDSLPEQAQKAIDEVGHSYPTQAIENVKAVEIEYEEILTNEGVTISEIDKTEFIEAAKSISDKFPEWSDGLYEDVARELGHE